MTDQALLTLIIDTCREHKITAYQISKEVDTSSFAIQKILNGETKKPLRKTLLDILSYLEANLPGVDLPVFSNKHEKEKPIKTSMRPHKGVPYYDIEISGSFVASFDDAKDFIRFYVDYEPLNDCTGFLPYAGDSMLPKYKSGDTLGVKQISNFDVILWGESHLVITNEKANSYKTVKNIYPHSDKSKVILRAINPEFSGDTEVAKEDILSLFIVKGKVELNQI